MSKDRTRDLLKFLKPFPGEVREIALWVRAFIWDTYPDVNELIYDDFNALAVGWSPTDRAGHTFCSFAVGRTNHNVQFGFYRGSELSDPEGRLLGKGNQYRYLLVQDKVSFPKRYIKKLMKEAYRNPPAKVRDRTQLVKGTTITKSISAKKRLKGAKPPSKKR